ncbi:hypothetical protein GCM10009841_34800 [Microlunatus panaciterrae]|uniref:Pimeloyl-ACP methyl ester carboxylesterase n=1 Tax=Microlunatus panaciterrae TaxID=400768 RepID=A0ABS2RGP1_9ACTN|nr:alpha/beta hydrolase [Microlunatus panaciterrae]MBM7798137.1 pimeloyl-ACP methyl ester carboxylesterase [Microlunatus panaciterrae]
MGAPGTVSRNVLAAIWLLVGLALILTPVWLAWSSWSTLLRGHPSLPAVALGSLIVGVVAVVWAIASLVLGRRYDAESRTRAGRRLTAGQLRRRAAWRITLAVPALLLSVLLIAALIWARPFPAGNASVVAMQTSTTVKIADRLTWYEMVPQRRDRFNHVMKPTGGLIFVPGARVDPQAYAPLLRPLAEGGYLVVVLKEPFGLAIPTSGHAEGVLKLHPEVPYWAIGGHSLGGVAAAAFADSHPVQISGLVLYASYPAQPLTRTELKVLSISGSRDRLTTPADIEASRARLPANSQFLVIDGAVHSFFGDYGSMSGDGTPTVDRAKAQATITRATGTFLASLKPKR